MMRLVEIVELNSGTPQFRIKESPNAEAPAYFFFGQSDIEDSLTGIATHGGSGKQIRTFDNVSTLESGDVIFSLISGKAAIVRSTHSGYLFTQNYVKLVPVPSVDPGYLVFMLNENADIKRQLHSGQQGSATLKFTIRQLSDLIFPVLPPIEKQRVIRELYFYQLRMAALKNRVAELETKLVVARLKEATDLE
jgi:hypothetical protein